MPAGVITAKSLLYPHLIIDAQTKKGHAQFLTLNFRALVTIVLKSLCIILGDCFCNENK